MAWRVIIRTTFPDSSQTSIHKDRTDKLGQKAQEVFDKYKSNGSILDIKTEWMGETERRDVMVFHSKDVYEKYRANLIEIYGGAVPDRQVEITDQHEVKWRTQTF